MINQRVTGLKVELAGDFANAYHDIPAKSPARPEDRVHYRRYLQPWFDRTLRQNKIRSQRVSTVILHDFECAFRLRISEGHPELVKASFCQTFPGNFPLRVLQKN